MSDKKTKDIIKDFSYAKSKRRKLDKEMKKDFEYLMGKQWDDSDKDELREAGIQALEINKIQPYIFLVSGVQRQNRSDLIAFPEGDEDTISAEITTRLLRNVEKQMDMEDRISEAFEDAITCGMAYLEPYMDYTYDLVTGKMRLKKVSPFRIYPDPESQEYDLSDARYVIKYTGDLTKNEVLQIFPEKESKIEKIEQPKISIDTSLQSDEQIGYPNKHYQHPDNEGTFDDREEETYDLIEYYYKKWIKKYIIIDHNSGQTQEFEDRETAEEFRANVERRYFDAGETSDIEVAERKIPEIWTTSMVGDTILDESQCPFYPRWKSYPFIPIFAHRMTIDIKDSERKIQGIVRSLRDVQDEHNKRRTQELRHINQSVNSGMWYPKGALDKKNKTKARRYGSSPGIHIEYDPTKTGGTTPQNWQMRPMPLSQGHEYLAQQSESDLQKISGINLEALALDNKVKSGRAIMLRQKQGLVMIQRIMDNLSRSKQLLGRFIVSQLNLVYTFEKAFKVLGKDYIRDLFERPVKDKQGNPVLKQGTQQLQMTVDMDKAKQVVKNILGDVDLAKYDVKLEEGQNSPTVKYANYIMLQEMAQKGVPIPPQVLLEESMLSSSSKKEVRQAIQQMQRQQQQEENNQGGNQ